MSMNVLHSETTKSWINAYMRFLRSRDENLILKIAPLLLVVGSPEVLVSNFVPFVGEALDIGSVGLGAIVLVRTLMAVRKYR